MRNTAIAGTKVKYVVDMDESAGRGTVTFQITESPQDQNYQD